MEEDQVDKLLTVADLGLVEKEINNPIFSAMHAIQPTKNGQRWCTREDAESIIVKTILDRMREVQEEEWKPEAFRKFRSLTSYQLKEMVDQNGFNVLSLSVE